MEITMPLDEHKAHFQENLGLLRQYLRFFAYQTNQNADVPRSKMVSIHLDGWEEWWTTKIPENPDHKSLESGKHQHAQSAWKTGFKNPSLGCGASNVPSRYMFSALITPCNHKTHVISFNSLDVSYAQNSCKLSKGVSIQVSMSK